MLAQDDGSLQYFTDRVSFVKCRNFRRLWLQTNFISWRLNVSCVKGRGLVVDVRNGIVMAQFIVTFM